MPNIQQAIDLIKQGRKREAQPILEADIRANPHDIKNWFWYVETLDSVEKRIQLLEVCLKQNSGNPQVLKALEMLRDNQSSAQVAPVYSPKVEPYTSPKREFEYADRQTDALYGDEASTSYSLYEKHGWGESGYEPKSNLPDIEIPENEKIILYLNNKNPARERILPFESSLITIQDPHVLDIMDLFLRQVADFPQDCKYFIYGYPVVIHPKTQIIFGFTVHTEIYYRLPAKISEKINTHFDNIFSRGQKKKLKMQPGDDITADYYSLPLESNWSDKGSYFLVSLIRKCYDYNGTRQSGNTNFHLDVEKDLREVHLPTFFDDLLDRLFLLLILGGGSALVLFVLYALDHFRISDVIEFFKSLR